MGNRLPNLPSRAHFFLVLAMGTLLSSHSLAAPGEFMQQNILGKAMLCATLLPEHEYSFIPPVHGRLMRLGADTLCYFSEDNAPENLHFVEINATGLLTDAGIITLPLTF
jgi:hypothetical protein